MKRVAVIGTGIMGRGIALNFLKKKYEVLVWNRTKSKLKDLEEAGAIIVRTPLHAAREADVVFEVTANDKSSNAVWTGKNGILAGATPDKVLITCATLSVAWTDSLSSMCTQNQLNFFDMPMTGGRVGAETGRLILLVGGDADKLKDIEKDLNAISQKVMYFGKAGNGMRYKLLLNTLQGIHIVAFGEVLNLARAIGLDIKIVGDALAERPGGTTTNIAWRDYQQEPDPINFSVEWITKDLEYAKKLSRKTATPLLDKTLLKYRQAMKRHLGQEDWTAVNKTEE